MQGANVAALVAIGAYMLVVLAIGFAGGRFMRATPADYFLAGRTVGGIAMVLTVAATFHSVFFLFGVPGYHYLHGFSALPAVLGMGATMVLSLWLFLPRFYLAGRAFGYITPGDYLGDYYRSRAVRLIVGAMMLVYVLPYLAIQTIGVAIGLETITRGAVPYAVGALVFLVVLMTYVLLGGFRAVVWTDVVQGLFFAVLAWVVGLWFLYRLGDGSLTQTFREVIDQRPENLTVPGGTGSATYPWIFNFWLIFGLAAGVQPWIWMRGYAARSIRIFPILLVGVPVLTILGQIPGVLSGTVGRAFVEGVPTPDALIPYALGQFAPTLAAVVLVAAFAASMSTSDSLLIATSAVLTTDLYKPLANRETSDSHLYLLGKVLIVVFAIVSFLIALTRPTLIIAFAAITWTGFAMLVPIVLGSFFWRRASRAGAVTGLVAGNVTDLVLVAVTWPEQTLLGWHFGLYGIAICSLAYFIVSLFTRPLPTDHIDRFHNLFRRAYAFQTSGESQEEARHAASL